MNERPMENSHQTISSINKEDTNYTKVLFKELKTFLAQFRISTAECDIFEHVLLDLTKIDKKRECHFNKLDDSHIWVCFGKMTRDESKIFLEFFKDKDIDIKISRCFYGDGLDDCEARYYDKDDDRYCIRKNQVTFSMNSELFYKNIFPVIKEKVTELTHQESELIEHYQKKSKKRFVNDEISVAKNYATQFHHAESSSTATTLNETHCSNSL